MLTTNTICSTFGGIFAKSAEMTSSSPSPSPVRLSPECLSPKSSSLPKKTAPSSRCSLEKQIADTSRSTSSPDATSQPRPANTCPSDPVSGRPNTSPFSIAKATFCRAGAPGMLARMRLPSEGSRMSTKCRPPCGDAGALTSSSAHSPRSPRTSMATGAAAWSDDERADLDTSFSFRSSRMCMDRLGASRKLPPLYAATTKMTSLTCFSSSLSLAKLAKLTQITSSSPAFSPVCSSPEWVIDLRAFRLL
mmetsp:Transcript_84647/g.224280  ORF Transcript_84647/g.224280 Transcript_84647/m.224280 type:complete len:249 (+) Transcript_84647:544-1290(+)